MTTQKTFNASKIIGKANEIIRDAKYTKLVKVNNPAQSQLVMTGPDFSIYISLLSDSVYALIGNIVYKLK